MSDTSLEDSIDWQKAYVEREIEINKVLSVLCSYAGYPDVNLRDLDEVVYRVSTVMAAGWHYKDQNSMLRAEISRLEAEVIDARSKAASKRKNRQRQG